LIYFYHSNSLISETKSQIFYFASFLSERSQRTNGTELFSRRTWLGAWWARWLGWSPAWRGRRRCLMSLLRRENIKNTRRTVSTLSSTKENTSRSTNNKYRGLQQGVVKMSLLNISSFPRKQKLTNYSN